MTNAVTKVSDFKWTPNRDKAAFALAEGRTRDEAAAIAGVAQRTIFRWLDNPEFSAEVDRLSLMIGVASKAERLRIAMRVIRGRTDLSSIPQSRADLLDWLKFVQSETDGIKIELTALLAALAPVAGSGPDGVPGPPPAQLTSGNGRADPES